MDSTIRFFGDSWYWCWFPNSIKSKKLLELKYLREGYPILKMYLDALNIKSITHNSPGNSFEKTTESILATTEHDNIKYNVVFYSSIVRRTNFLQEESKNYKQFIRNLDKKVEICLDKIQEWAEHNEQQVILIGGQSTIESGLVKNKKNIHLISSCIISSVLRKNINFGRFKLATDITDFLNEETDPRLVNQIYFDIKNFEEDTGRNLLTWPDSGHLNPTGMIFLLDRILYKIEDLERLKK